MWFVWRIMPKAPIGGRAGRDHFPLNARNDGRFWYEGLHPYTPPSHLGCEPGSGFLKVARDLAGTGKVVRLLWDTRCRSVKFKIQNSKFRYHWPYPNP